MTYSLVVIGRDHGTNGSMFVAPPENLVVRVEEERHRWVAILPTTSSVSSSTGDFSRRMLAHYREDGSFSLYIVLSGFVSRLSL
ncbi:hypothetical protein V6N12_015664 [Hibiscus sabdariffa]|uniref:Uncharacterized protein n=1 Tax=Hibiscus sabdariffa TaxID=183260 RepID=A0ABR2DQB7_9ROSI